MAIQKIHPYVHLNGQAEAAVRFYEKALGAQVGRLTRYREAPMTIPESHQQRIMHAELRIGGGVLMISDAPPGMDLELGHGYDIMVEFGEREELVRAFTALTTEGRVVMPLQDMFWGGHMGMAVDRFGVSWILAQMPAAS